MKKIYYLIAFALFCSLISIAQIKVGQLLTENLTNPVGIGIANPRFSWQLVSEKRNVKQTAYEIEVKEKNKTIWSSGKVVADASIFNEYAGPALKSNIKYSWRVRIFDNYGNVSAWADAYFQTALLQISDWKAAWISSGLKADTVNGIVPLFRKTFTVTRKIVAATAFVTACGVYEAHINGKRLGDAYLTPGWTSFSKHLQYQTYDVTPFITAGKNNINVLLASGWYRTRLGWTNSQNNYGAETALLFQTEISYADGTKETIVSDNSWTATASDIVYSELYDGEIQDAGKKQPAGSAVEGYSNPVVIKELTKNNLTAAVNEPIRKHETLKPVRIFESPRGETILDFGQNLVGWVSLQVQGKKGDTVRLSHFEMLDKKGLPYFENLRSAKAQATYILKGNGRETFEPHFTFFGFRYVKVEGMSIKPAADGGGAEITAIALYSDMAPTGTFECSNSMVNQLQKNIQWGQRGNFLDVPTDCPQRDERLGWTGDAEVFSRTAAYNFNVNQFFAKWLKDVIADQYENGAVPFVIPDVIRKWAGPRPNGAAGWSDASIIIPYNMYVAYGDKRLLTNQYPSMKAYLNYVRKSAKNDLWNTGFQFGDWLSYRVDDSKGMIGMKSAITDNYLVAQCFFAYNVQLMLNAAQLLDKADDVKDYTALLGNVKTAFQNEFMTVSGRLISETQTAYILALQFDMLPEPLRPQAVERLVNNIASYNYHLTTGFLGTPFLNPVLTRFGKNDVAYKLLLQDSYPSWLYPIKTHGATTIWERWDSMKPDSTFQDPSMTSFNHYSYGAVGDWMYRTIAGIDSREGAGAGYKDIIIKPQIGGNITFAKGTLKTNYGLLSSSWKLDNNKMVLDVEIPANSTATVYIPASKTGTVTEDKKPLAQSKDIQVKGMEGDYLMVQTGSGKYHFEVSK